MVAGAGYLSAAAAKRRYAVSLNNVALDDANLIFLQWLSRLKLGATRRPDSGHSGIREIGDRATEGRAGMEIKIVKMWRA